MNSYRTDTLDRLAHGDLKLSAPKGRKLRAELRDTRTRYEELVAETFPYVYLEHFRIAIFGSARGGQDSPDARFVRELARRLGEELELTVITGGGPGIMAAANEGLRDAVRAERRRSEPTQDENLGVLLDFLGEPPNEFLDVAEKVENFSVRLEEFVRLSHGVYLAPGGWGTDLEAMIFAQLAQLGKLEPGFPLLAHPFWQPIFGASSREMYDERLRSSGRGTSLISRKDRELIHFSGDIEEIVETFRAAHGRWAALRERTLRSRERSGDAYLG